MKRHRFLLAAAVIASGVVVAYPFGFTTPAEPAHGKKPTTIVFGDGPPKILRPRIGVAHLAAGIRPLPEDWLVPTELEFDAWLATEDAGPLQDWLAAMREAGALPTGGDE